MSEKELTGKDSLDFEALSDEVRVNVEDVVTSLVTSPLRRTANAFVDVAVVSAERVQKGTVQVKNLSATDVVGTGNPSNLVQTQILGSNDGGKTFEFVVAPVETGVSPANSLGAGSSRLLELPHTNVAGVPNVLSHYKVQARAHAAGAQGTVQVKGAFSMMG